MSSSESSKLQILTFSSIREEVTDLGIADISTKDYPNSLVLMDFEGQYCFLCKKRATLFDLIEDVQYHLLAPI